MVLSMKKESHVFHISSLQKKLRERPPVSVDGIVQAEPQVILDRRLAKKQGRAVTEVLAQWQGAAEEDSTWEDYHCLQQQFPHLNLKDKVVFRRGQ